LNEKRVWSSRLVVLFGGVSARVLNKSASVLSVHSYDLNMPSDESDLWKRIVETPVVEKEMIEKGFFLSSESFRRITSSFGAHMRLRAPEYLSKDFWSRQPPSLVERGYYVLRVGMGKFALLDERVFPRPYLSLETSSASDLNPKVPRSFKQLRKAFGENAQENASLEQMRFLGIFDQMITDLFGTNEYFVGPRGNRSSSFDIFVEKKNNEKTRLCTYQGQEELDYSLWTEDEVLLFEAKQTQRSASFLDIGWHKLVYSASRFRDYEILLLPTYFLRRRNEIFMFVFAHVQFYESGIVINDSRAMKPKKIYRVRL